MDLGNMFSQAWSWFMGALVVQILTFVLGFFVVDLLLVLVAEKVLPRFCDWQVDGTSVKDRTDEHSNCYYP